MREHGSVFCALILPVGCIVHSMAITFEHQPELDMEQVARVYDDVGWAAYTADVSGMMQAIENSTFVVAAREGSDLIGLARCISDDVSICYLQDILVRSNHQRSGIGRELFRQCTERFSHVRMFVLMTDDEPRQEAFYTSMGMDSLTEHPNLRMYIKNSR